MKKVFLTLFAICAYQIVSAQQVTTNESFTLQQLVEQLVQGCVEISNVSSTINGNIDGFNSYAAFSQSGSNFPFANGLVLTTGRASEAGNGLDPIPLNSGTTNWGTDPDMEAVLGVNNTLNATSIEFDFIAVTNQISFNYLLASEEYAEDFPCRFSDSFAFLIRPTGSTAPYTNIAVVPGTNIPVSTSVIHDEIVGFCPAENEEYFEGYNLGDTNYNGRTTVLTATATLIPNQQYHIKLVLADGTDQNADSAIFIEGNSFNATVDLGLDITTCANSYLLNADIGNPLATYQWFRNGVPIPGSINTTHDAVLTGSYRVEITIPVGTETCVIEDTVQVTLNTPQTIEPLTDYELCDNTGNDGVESFDLTIKEPEILAEVPPGNYTISYYPSQNDAENETNPFATTISNTTSPQEVFVRVWDNDNGCLSFTSFNLVVNELPQINTPTPIDICDDNSDGISQINLTIRNDEITGMNPVYGVTYHNSQSDADNNINPIIGDYTNSAANNTVFVRVVNTETGCVNQTTLEVNVGVAPMLTFPDRNLVDACDPEHDGFASFDLTEIINNTTVGLTGVTITVHTSLDDATTGANPIPDVTAFNNTNPEEQSLYIRVVDDATGCFAISPFTVHTNALLTATNILDINRCDDASNDGIFNFDFQTITASIQNSLSFVQIEYFLSEDDRDNNVNAIDITVPFANTENPQEIFIRLTDVDTGCEDIASFNLVVNPFTPAPNIGTLTTCDTNSDEIVNIDLQTFTPDIVGTNTDFDVIYFLSASDANFAVNAVTDPIINTSNPQEIFFRFRNSNTGCFDIGSFMMEVLPAPDVNTPNTILICDDTDGIADVDLTQSLPEIITDLTNIDISYHSTLSGVFNDSDIITNPTAYSTGTTSAYVRVENATTGCFARVELPIIVNTVPVVTATDIYQLCETDTDETENFIMETRDDEILNGQTDMTVFYYPTAQDALDKTNEIDKTAPYANQTNPQTIHVRIENDTDPDCFAVSEFVIQVSPAPIYNDPTDVFVCDDISNDGESTFDLSITRNEIAAGISQNLTISFYTTLADAENNTNPIPDTFTNTVNPQAIYARISNDSECITVADFALNVIQVPEANPAPDVTVCDVDYDGQVVFDLTEAEFSILNIRQDNVVITYHETQDDADNGANAIANPTNYTNSNNPQPIFVRLFNTISGCYVIVPFTLNVNLPPLMNNVPTATFCDAEVPGTVDLNQIEEIIIDDSTGITISYYNSAAEADSDTNALPDIYTYMSNPETIFVRAEDDVTGCYFVQSIDITMIPNPIANPVSDMEACIDDNANTTQTFDFSTQTATILGAQNPGLFTVSYHVSIEDAQNDVNPLPPLYNAFNEQNIYVRVENNQTGCFATTSFMTIVHPLPVINLPEDITLCLNDLPLTVSAGNTIGNSYLWSTGEITPSIDIITTGTYSVTVTSPFGCVATDSFDVNESELATIVEVDVVNFSENNVITVTASGNGDYVYSLDGGTPQTSNVFEYVGPGYHVVTVADINGCGEVSEEVVVIDYIKFVTPNNDGYNDTWHIIGIETLPNSVVYIFDRYGKLLKTLRATDPGWDGTYRGRRMPSSDYWFLAEIKDGPDSFDVKGHFTLKR
ncbi:gliding motility-associated-like protein [Kordia periserrulae]|uniref:Gliding motility-associated-like protein n=1 Tax=Kordia periserrulae TaxID=701523 RepID=A0A2T6BSA3_9FLAO|nr:T9SS type B sorting domain-containing protein [Kordia periserrulae]PTX58934.1 gliding motility-associated-like protein [Kordia periserrulae]